MWVQALAALPRRARPRTWDDGVDGTLLCHLLFSVHDDPAEGAAMLRFRCGPVHTRWAGGPLRVGLDRGLTSRAARHSGPVTARHQKSTDVKR